MESKAVLRMARISPQKARLVADMIRGKPAIEAEVMLRFTRKKAAKLFLGLVESAVANAEFKAQKEEEGHLEVEDLIIKRVFVDQGPTLRRFRPRARGSANRIHKKTSHITLVLETPQHSEQ